MSCENFRGTYELYALSVLEGVEKQQIDAHLAAGCETCRKSLTDAQVMNALLMATSAPELQPPSRLKHRLLASLGVPVPGWTWAATLAAACMLILALWLASQERNRGRELAQARSDVLQVSADRDRLLQALRFLNLPETREVSFGKVVRGNLFLNQDRGIVLICSNLPHLEAGKALEMWLIPSRKNGNGSPRPAGLFEPDADGTGLHILPGAVDLASIETVAVTIEPQGGSPAPTSTPIIAANIAF